jgi:excinuclease ABC subunit C
VADPHGYRPAPGSIPESPGVYRFRDKHGRVIYVGKAKNLRSRLNSYFADFAGLHPRTQAMLSTAAGVDWTVVGTEVESLQLEYSWIKEFNPRFNIRYRDDKSYPYLAVTLDEKFPGDGDRAPSGAAPGISGRTARARSETVDTLLRVFPVRTCSAGVFKRAGQIGRPCLLGYIGKCSAPCVGRITEAEHRNLAEEFCDFMAGQTARFTKRLEGQMRAAAQAEEYERAARLRDDIQALARALERQAVVLGDGTDCDVIALAEDQLEAAVQVFYVRGGRVRGQRGWVVDKVEEVTASELVEQFLGQVYGEDAVASPGGYDRHPGGADGEPGRASIPREVLVPVLPPAAPAVEEWLCRQRGSGSCGCPGAGTRRRCWKPWPNAAESLTQHKMRRASDLTTRSRAWARSRRRSGWTRRRCGSSATTCPTCRAPTSSRPRWCSRTGWPARASTAGSASGNRRQGDVAAIHEVITAIPPLPGGTGSHRRTGHAGGPGGRVDRDPAERRPAAGRPGPLDEDGRPRKFAYPPNLVVVDGGPAQSRPRSGRWTNWA